MKKGQWVHVPKFNILGRWEPKLQLIRENAKNRGFSTGPTPGRQKFSLFFSKTLVWDYLGTFKTLTACPPDITPKKCLYTGRIEKDRFVRGRNSDTLKGQEAQNI